MTGWRSRRRTPEPPRPSVDDVLGQIDATVDGHCACGCGTALSEAGPSGWFASERCQAKFQARGRDPLPAEPDEFAGFTFFAEVVFGELAGTQIRDSAASWINTDELAYLRDALRSRPALTYDNRDPAVATGTLALTNDPFPPVALGRGVVDPELGYKRWCLRCEAWQRPVVVFRFRLKPPVTAVRYDYAAGPTCIPADGIEGGHGCGRCGQLFPAPALWASITHSDGKYHLGLTGAGRPYATASVEDYQLDDAVGAAAALWADMELSLAEYTLPACALPGCEERARAWFVVLPRTIMHDPFELCGRIWTPGDRIGLCPEHEGAVWRGCDPARPSDRRADLELVSSPA